MIRKLREGGAGVAALNRWLSRIITPWSLGDSLATNGDESSVYTFTQQNGNNIGGCTVSRGLNVCILGQRDDIITYIPRRNESIEATDSGCLDGDVHLTLQEGQVSISDRSLYERLYIVVVRNDIRISAYINAGLIGEEV